MTSEELATSTALAAQRVGRAQARHRPARRARRRARLGVGGSAGRPAPQEERGGQAPGGRALAAFVSLLTRFRSRTPRREATGNFCVGQMWLQVGIAALHRADALPSRPPLARGRSSPSSRTAARRRPSDDGTEGGEDAYTSASAKLLDFEFDGEVTMAGGDAAADDQGSDALHDRPAQRQDRRRPPRQARAHERAQRPSQGELTRVRYHAKLPVSWRRAHASRAATRSSSRSAPTTAGQEAFFTKYSARPASTSARTTSTPASCGTTTGPSRRAARSPPPTSSRRRRPCRVQPREHDRQVPRVRQGLGGQRAQRRRDLRQVRGRRDHRGRRRHRRPRTFVGAMKPRARRTRLVTPADDVPTARASRTPTSPSRARSPTARRSSVTRFLVDNVREGGAGVRARATTRSPPDADVIVYNGHAGLGQNVRALAHEGTCRRAST